MRAPVPHVTSRRSRFPPQTRRDPRALLRLRISSWAPSRGSPLDPAPGPVSSPLRCPALGLGLQRVMLPLDGLPGTGFSRAPAVEGREAALGAFCPRNAGNAVAVGRLRPARLCRCEGGCSWALGRGGAVREPGRCG